MPQLTPRQTMLFLCLGVGILVLMLLAVIGHQYQQRAALQAQLEEANAQRARLIEQSATTEGQIAELQNQITKLNSERAEPVVLVTQPPNPNDPNTQLADVFEPAATTTGGLDKLKERYEALFVNLYILSRCNANQPDDYYVLNTVLLKEMAAVNAASRLRKEILTAARGSYAEVYSKLDCARAAPQESIAQFRRYIDGVRAQGMD